MPDPASDRLTLPLHHLHRPVGNPKISTRSHWNDLVWFIDNSTPGQRKGMSAIRWSVPLHDGSRLTDPQWVSLLDAFKCFAWSLLTDSRDGGRPFKPGSLSNIGTGVRALAAWMVKSDYADFGELDARAAERFIEDLTIRFDADESDHEKDTSSLTAAEADENRANDISVEANGLAFKAIRTRLSVWALLWRQRDALADAGLRPPLEPPFNGQSVWKVAQRIAALAEGWIPPLPDEVALPIMAAAHAMIGAPADDIIRLQDAYLDAYARSGPRGGKSTASRAKAGRKTITSFTFSIPPGTDKPWRGPIMPEKQVDTFRGTKHRTTIQILSTLIQNVRDACVIVLQSHAGLRINEVCSLKAGVNPETGLPACIEIRKSRTGLNDLFLLKGLLAKTEKAPREVEWLVGSRPRGSKHLPGPVRAVQVLDQLFAPWRTLNPERRDDLIVGFAHMNSMPTTAKTINLINTILLLFGQKDFVQQYVDLSGLPDRNAAGEDLAIYRETKGACLRTHQWRKTFALYCFRLDSRMLPAITQQFKHLSLAMTEEGYIGSDPTLVEALDDARMRETARTFYEFTTGKSATAGPFSYVLEDHRKEIESIVAGTQTPKEANDAIRRWCLDNDIRIWFTQFGKCYVAHNPKAARCHEIAGTAHWANTQPNPETRCPETCLECHCFGIDGDHVEFWTDRYAENQTLWEQAKAANQAGEYRVAQRRADQSRQILERLQVPLPRIEVPHA